MKIEYRKGAKRVTTWGSIDGLLTDQRDLDDAINQLEISIGGKQDVLTSGSNIKTINGQPVVGSGDMAVGSSWGGISGTLTAQTDLKNALNKKQDTLVSGDNIKTINGVSLVGPGDVPLSKASVGLSNVDNTSDANKPISTATQTALNGKQATLQSGTNIKSINGQSIVGSGDLVFGGVGNGGDMLRSEFGVFQLQKIFATNGAVAWSSGNFSSVGSKDYVLESGNLYLRHTFAFTSNTKAKHGIFKGTYSVGSYLPYGTGVNQVGVPYKLFPIEMEVRVRFYNYFFNNAFQFGFCNNATTPSAGGTGVIEPYVSEPGLLGIRVYNGLSGLVTASVHFGGTHVENLYTLGDTEGAEPATGFKLFPFWTFKIKSNLATQNVEFYANNVLIYQMSFTHASAPIYLVPSAGLCMYSTGNGTPGATAYYDIDYLKSNF